MAITVLKHNAPWGPFSRAQIDEALQRGDFTLQYLAHAPGLKEWLPLGEVLHFVDTAASLPPVPKADAIAVPPNLPPVPPRISVPPKLNLELETASKPLTTTPILPIAERPEPLLDAASFFSRAIAFFIDCGILFIPITFIFALGAVTIEIQGWWEQTEAESMRQEWALLTRNFHQLLLLVAIGLGWLYAAGLESSRWQATVGKRWMGVKVTDVYGERLGFLHASGRHAGKYLSALPCFLGFMMALFSSRGLTLHDRLASTRVVRH